MWGLLWGRCLSSIPDLWFEISRENPKGNQPWIFIGRTDVEAEVPVLWPPYAKNWFIGKDPDAGKDWRQKEKGVAEGEMVGWHHWLNGHEFEKAPGDGEGQGSLASCSPWGRKEWDMTLGLNNNNNQIICNVILLSGVQQSDSIIYAIFQILFYYRLLWDIEYSSL